MVPENSLTCCPPYQNWNLGVFYIGVGRRKKRDNGIATKVGITDYLRTNVFLSWLVKMLETLQGSGVRVPTCRVTIR